MNAIRTTIEYLLTPLSVDNVANCPLEVKEQLVILTTVPSPKALLVEKTLYRQFFYPNVQICTVMGRYLEAVEKFANSAKNKNESS